MCFSSACDGGASIQAGGCRPDHCVHVCACVWQSRNYIYIASPSQRATRGYLISTKTQRNTQSHIRPMNLIDPMTSYIYSNTPCRIQHSLIVPSKHYLSQTTHILCLLSKEEEFTLSYQFPDVVHCSVVALT